jgi:hypothetical protein
VLLLTRTRVVQLRTILFHVEFVADHGTLSMYIMTYMRYRFYSSTGPYIRSIEAPHSFVLVLPPCSLCCWCVFIPANFVLIECNNDTVLQSSAFMVKNGSGCTFVVRWGYRIPQIRTIYVHCVPSRKQTLFVMIDLPPSLSSLPLLTGTKRGEGGVSSSSCTTSYVPDGLLDDIYTLKWNFNRKQTKFICGDETK